MRRLAKYLAACLAGGVILSAAVPALPQSPWTIEAQAHSGRTDSHGGHKDNKNVSGLGSYHYHCGGNPAHLHENGTCPYDTTAVSNSGSHHNQAVQSTQAVPSTQAVQEHHASGGHGWEHGGDCWKYRCEDGSMASDCWKQIDGCWYAFDETDRMRTGWYDCDSGRYYLGTDGKMVTGDVVVDNVTWHFDESGKLIQ